MKNKSKKRPMFPGAGITLAVMAAVIIAVSWIGVTKWQASNAASSGGSGGAQTDQTNLSYTANAITSRYHLYAAGLDWSKQVGMMIYGDGSGEFGLKNPSSTYLLAGTNGLINVAKRNNMVLVTPLAPGGDCPDGGGTCWYQTSGGYTRLQKTQWAEALVKYVQSRYPIELNRVAVGGYSSGAQLASQAWVPSGAAQRTMTDGVIVSISCGGPPAVSEVAYPAAFKSSIHMNWNTGDNDTSCPHTATWSTAGGYSHYTGAGFQTSRDILPGVTHSRSGAFGSIMDAQIKEHVVPSGGTTPMPPPPPPPPPQPVTNPYACPTRPTLQLGSQGVCVQRVQWFLNQQINAGLTIDGDFGSVTQTSVRTYQTGKALPVSGIVDGATWNALEGTIVVDITPPTSSLSASPTSVTAGGTITLSATATDNVGIAKVEFYNGAALLGTDTSAPYSYSWNTTGQTGGAKSLTAKAFDLMGNTRTSAIVSVSVIATPPTSNGDVNGDGRVNALDLSALIARDGQNYPPADLNGDGTVGAADLAIMLSKWTW